MVHSQERPVPLEWRIADRNNNLPVAAAAEPLRVRDTDTSSPLDVRPGQADMPDIRSSFPVWTAEIHDITTKNVCTVDQEL